MEAIMQNNPYRHRKVTIMSPPVCTGPTSAGFQSNPLSNMLL